MQGREVFVVDAVRTPVGRLGGALAKVRPDDLGACVIRALLERTPSLDPARIGEVLLRRRQPGRRGQPQRRPDVRPCWPACPPRCPARRSTGSARPGLDAVVGAARTIAVGDASIMVAGGVESMTRAPYVLPKPERPFPAGNATMYSTTLGWRMTNPAMPDEWTVSLGESTELLGEKYGVTREAADAFAVRSQRAGRRGVGGRGVRRGDRAGAGRRAAPRRGDPRRRHRSSRSARLKPSFRADGTVTAGNASQLSDGAAALLLADADGVAELGVEPLARITATGVDARRPAVLRDRPGARRSNRALAKAGRTLADVTHDGAQRGVRRPVAGVPVASGTTSTTRSSTRTAARSRSGTRSGCSGARLAGAVAHQLAAAGSGVGVAALCIGVGQGLAVTMER